MLWVELNYTEESRRHSQLVLVPLAMSDSSLEWVGLFDPSRQKRLLAGVDRRVQRTRQELEKLHLRQQEQEKVEVERLEVHRHETINHCREQRREMLQRWDEAEERLTHEYETNTVRLTDDLHRLAAQFRKKAGEERKVIERKVAARRVAVNQQHDNHRNVPGQTMRREISQIEHALEPLREELERARALTIRRVDRLPEIPPPQTPEDDFREPPPESVREAVDVIQRVSRRIHETVVEMHQGAPSRIVDSFYLPVGVATFIVIWVIAVLIVRPEQRLLWMAASVPISGSIGFLIYGILLMPLRAMTRRLYPRAERLMAAADAAADAGRRIAMKQASDASAELLQRRDAHLEAAAQWQHDQLAELEERTKAELAEARRQIELEIQQCAANFTLRFDEIGAQMRNEANSLAQSISETVARSDHERQARLTQLATQRLAEKQRAEHRFTDGLARGLQRIDLARVRVAERFPRWEALVDGPVASTGHLPCLPVGQLRVDGPLRSILTDRDHLQGCEDQRNIDPRSIPDALPVVLHRRLHAGLVIQTATNQMDQAIDLAQAVLWRLLSSVVPGQSKLTLIDPIGRGQNFTSFLAMTDHRADLVGHRVWSGERQIEQRLAELADHSEDLLQVTLRDRFERIEDYNETAGLMAEPYRAIAAIGFPEGLTRDGYKHLRAIVDSSLRCGVLTILVCDDAHPWPAEMPLIHDRRWLKVCVNEDGDWSHGDAELSRLPFTPAASPPTAIRAALVRKIGIAAVAAARVEIPFHSIVNGNEENHDPRGESDQHSGDRTSDHGLCIPLGVQGTGRLQSLHLGEGIKQHVLIAGKPGSGKSSLLHTLITSGAVNYCPSQLQFYLLDLSDSVGFKVYADQPLPHARIVGIHSEREFVRSVMQRLDVDLRQRVEAFRSAGVEELGDYRRQSGLEMPRVVLLIDEFQELFARNDRLASECATLLDRLVHQGRSLGMHVVLSSGSLSETHALLRGTLRHMAVRVALPCSECDAAAILSDENTAARLIGRPGEAIYNDAGGQIEGNQPFQVAYLAADVHRDWLQRIASRDRDEGVGSPLPIVFEGNRPTQWTPALASSVLNAGCIDTSVKTSLRGLLGESVELGPPITLKLTRDAGKNALFVGPPESIDGVLASLLASMLALARGSAHDPLKIVFFDGGRTPQRSLATWLTQAATMTEDPGRVVVEVVKPRDSEPRMAEIAQSVRDRTETKSRDAAAMLVVVDPLERFRDFRQDDASRFSRDAGIDSSGSASLQKILRDGPPVGVFAMLTCGSAETIDRWLPRQSRHDLQLRLLGRVSAGDSSALIDSPEAANLSAATMLVYDDADGSSTKFRRCEVPSPEDVSRWIADQ